MVVNVIFKEEELEYGEGYTMVLSTAHSRKAATNFVKAQVDKVKKEMCDGGWAQDMEEWYDVHCCSMAFEKNEVRVYIDIHTVAVEELD